MSLIFDKIRKDFAEAFCASLSRDPEFRGAVFEGFVYNAIQFVLSVKASGDNTDSVNGSVEAFCYYLNEFSEHINDVQTKFLTEFINYVIYENSNAPTGYFVDATKGYRTW